MIYMKSDYFLQNGNITDYGEGENSQVRKATPDELQAVKNHLRNMHTYSHLLEEALGRRMQRVIGASAVKYNIVIHMLINLKRE